MRAGVDLRLPLSLAGAEGFCPLLGGVLELSGVLGGRPSFASSSATRANSVSHCLVSAAIISACARTRRISVSLSSESSPSRVIQSLNQLPILQSNIQTTSPKPRSKIRREQLHGQSLYAQVKQLRAAEAEKVFRETTSGARAVASGVRLSRKPTLNHHQQEEAIKRLNAGSEAQDEIARSYNVSRWTISRRTV